MVMLKRVLGYLKTYPNPKIVFDTSYMNHNKYEIEDQDWKKLYPDAQEELPEDMLNPKGKKVRITCWVDANFAHDLVTRRSTTGIILFLNNTPIRTISK